MKLLTLFLILVFAVIGAANFRQEWAGLVGGSIVGLFFALAIIDSLSRNVAYWVLPPIEQ